MLDELLRRMEHPTSRGLADAVSRAVADGVLVPGQKLPPIRFLSRELRLSPTTISAAWALLARSGTIRTDGRRGTVVASRTHLGPARYRRALQRTTRFQLDLSSGVPDPALLPDLAHALRRLNSTSTPETYLDEPVVPELIEILRADWPFPAEELTIVDGALDALDLVITCFVRFGDRVAVEHPCFPPVLDRLDAAGARPVAVALDDDGPLPGELAAAIAAGCRVFLFQPRAQNPTGASLTPDRAERLAAVAADADLLIVENDSAGAVASTEPVSLGTPLAGRTLHIRSFSKSHGPDLRLAALGGPSRPVTTVVERRHLGQGWTSRLLQRLLFELLTDDAAIAQVDHARREYVRRRAALTAALERHGTAVAGKDGINIWLPVTDEAAALVGLASQGIGATAGTPFAVREQEPHLRVTAGLLATDHPRVATALAGAASAGAFSGAR